MFVILSSNIPEYCIFFSEQTIGSVTDLNSASKFADSNIAEYYLEVVRKSSKTKDFKILDLPNVIFGNKPTHVIDSLSEDKLGMLYQNSYD